MTKKQIVSATLALILMTLIIIVVVSIFMNPHISALCSIDIDDDNIESFSDNAITDMNEIYDEFYSRVYDKILSDSKRNSYEVATILNETVNNKRNTFGRNINILDAGCGTGINSKVFGTEYNTTCLDSSKDMLSVANVKATKKMTLLQGDIKDTRLFEKETFTHIISTYFTIYYFKNIAEIFKNFYSWLKPKGFAIIHLVDKHAFDPIVNSSSFHFTDQQKYSEKRKTNSVVVFDKFTYKSNFKLLNDINAEFQESFHFKDGKIRNQKQSFYMHDKKHYIDVAEKLGFTLLTIVPQDLGGYAHNYLFIFQKN